MPSGKVAQAVFELAGKRPSEAGLEVNVLRHLANCLEEKRLPDEGGITITVPTQPEENKLGFDAATDLAPGLYVALQFKRPDPPKGGTTSFHAPTGQLCRLLRYPPKSAFYVLPAVETNTEMWKVRDGLLDRALLVDSWDLLPLCGGGGLHGPAPKGNPFGENDLKIQIDGRSPCTALAHTEMHGTGPSGVAARPARYLCRGCCCSCDGCRQRAWAGFVVKDEKIRTREGSGWSRDEFCAEAARRLGLEPAPADPCGPESGTSGGPDDREDRGALVRRILDYAERGGGGRGRASWSLARIGDAP